MKKFFKWLGILIGAFIVLIIIVSVISGGGNSSTPATTSSTSSSSSSTPSGAPAAKATPTPMPSVGSTASKGNWEVTLEKTERAKSLADAFGKDAVPQGQFLSVLANVKNIGKETYPLNQNDFTVIAPGDIKFKLASQLTLKEIEGYKTVWLSITVQPTLSQKMRLIFDVPPDAKGLQLDVQGIRFAIPD